MIKDSKIVNGLFEFQVSNFQYPVTSIQNPEQNEYI